METQRGKRINFDDQKKKKVNQDYFNDLQRKKDKKKEFNPDELI